MEKKISIKDIARELQISPTAVSFVLNGKAKEMRVSGAVVARVEEYIRETGYKPNSLARSLRTGKTHIITLMIENIANPFFANIARLIEEKALDSGYKIIYSSTDNDPVRSRELIQMYRERHVDGYIITPAEGMEDAIGSLIKAGLPVVLFDRSVAGLPCDMVVIDNEHSAYGATRHLLEQGCRNIGFITLSSVQSQMQDRLAGYKKALQEAGMEPCVETIDYTSVVTDGQQERSIKRFLESHPQLDAILFGTNYIGVSALKVMRSMQLKIPDDLAVVSFDDHDVFQLNSPPITAIAQPLSTIAEHLITLLLAKLTAAEHANDGGNIIVVPAELVVRDSSRKKMAVKTGS